MFHLLSVSGVIKRNSVLRDVAFAALLVNADAPLILYVLSSLSSVLRCAPLKILFFPFFSFGFRSHLMQLSSMRSHQSSLFGDLRKRHEGIHRIAECDVLYLQH